MKIGQYDFELVTVIEPARTLDGKLQRHMPQDRYKNEHGVALNKYGWGPFCRFKIPSHFQASGVYVPTVDEEIIYAGECTNLSVRFNAGYGNISPKNCFKGGQETNCRVNNLVYLAAETGKSIGLWFIRTSDYKTIEAALRSSLKLAWNRI